MESNIVIWGITCTAISDNEHNVPSNGDLMLIRKGSDTVKQPNIKS